MAKDENRIVIVRRDKTIGIYKNGKLVLCDVGRSLSPSMILDYLGINHIDIAIDIDSPAYMGTLPERLEDIGNSDSDFAKCLSILSR